jgi:HEAT repeats
MLCPAIVRAQPPRVGTIEFFGLRKVKTEKIRLALGVREGNLLPGSKGAVEERLEALPGVVRARLEAVCCAHDDAILFVGIEERGSPHFQFNDPPSGSEELPADIVETYNHFTKAVIEAAREGRTGEQLRDGHSLMADPDARKLQERFLVFAELYLPLLKKVLRNSANDEHRAFAAALVGYAPRKQDVIEDLQYAIRDPDDSVRDNAMRALTAISVLSARDKDLDLRISPTWLVEMLNSIVWTDRKKATMTLLNLTESRPQKVLDLIRDRALISLAEMARWKSLDYAVAPFTLLGRVAGLSDKQIEDAWSSGQRESVIKQALKPPKRG